MLGITMEEESGGKENEQLMNPQRSILDFFKSPDKVKPAKKPSNLLSYFGTAVQKDTKHKEAQISDEIPNGTENVSGKMVDKGQRKKRKQKDRGMGDKDTEDFEEESNTKGNKRIRIEERSSKTYQEKENSKSDLKDEKNDGDGSTVESTLNMETSQNQTTAKVNGRVDKTKQIKKERKKSEQKSDNESNSNVTNDDNIRMNDNRQNSPSKKLSKKKKKLKLKDESKNLTVSVENRQTVTENGSGISKVDVCDTEEKHKKETVAEMCYEDFIKSIKSVEPEAQATDNVSMNGNDTGKKDEKTEDTLGMDDQLSKEDLYIKNYPSVSSFFSKVEKPKTTMPSDLEAVRQVTINVDVHSEPSVTSTNTSTPASCVKMMSPNLYSKEDDEIEIISSEIIVLDSKPSSKKSLFGVKNETPADIKNEKDQKPENLAETISSCEDSCFSEDSSICVVEDVEDASFQEKKRCFLQSSTLPEVPAKTTQGTLSFTKSGVNVQKPVAQKLSCTTRIRKKDHEQIDDSSALDGTPEKKPAKPGRKKSTTVGIKNTPGGKKSSAKSLTKSKDWGKIPDEQKITSETEKKENPDVNERRKSLRSRYRVAIISEQSDSKTPIRLKFHRYSKSSSSGVEDGDNFTPRSKQLKKKMKLSKAKELLEKAKHSKDKKKKKKLKKDRAIKVKQDKGMSTDNEATSGRRRSSRLSNKQTKDTTIVVDSDDEVDGFNTVKSKSSKGRGLGRKGTPGKATPTKGRKTPQKKTTGKLAPIFMGGKAPKPVVVLDPEAEKLKRAFLMSGVPEELRRQTYTSASEAVVADNYPPLPTVNHTQQKEPQCKSQFGVKLWDLPCVKLPRMKENVVDVTFNHVKWEKEFISCKDYTTNCSHIKNFQKHEKIVDTDVEKIFAEISSYCPSYPVKKVFSILKEKKDDFDQEIKEAEQSEKKPVEEKISEKAAPRRSLRRKRVSLELPEVVELGSSPPSTGAVPNSAEDSVNKQDTVPTVSWTDKYLPLHSSEVVGNTVKIRKLQSWLKEWKQRLDKEARKAKMLMMKQNKGKQAKEQSRDDWWDDDSDFAMDSDDSDEEDDRLCNTAMLCGPSGIGKTAAVYALAHELGYKVFEVNASSVRNGKRILAQLQEATQSHQVSRTSDTPTKCPPAKSTGANQLSAKVPSAFSSFFKPQATKPAPSAKGKPEKQSSKEKKRKRDAESTENLDDKKSKQKRSRKDKSDCLIVSDSKADGSLNLSSTSLILFEEVDIVFDSDHGFWSAVQQFMATTKIPIILTTSDTGLVNKFDGRFDHFSFKTPSYRNIAVYLQLICLAENVRTDFWDVYNLVSMCQGDIRQCLLSLQYWLISGGGIHSVSRSIKKSLTVLPQTEVENESVSQQKELPQDQPDEDVDDDFVCLKPVCHRRTRVMSDDESSNSMPAVPMNPQHDAVIDSVIEPEPLPLVHIGHTSSLLGLNLQGSDSIMSALQKMLEADDDKLLMLATQVCQQYQSLKCDLLHRHHLSLLPLPKTELSQIMTTSNTKSVSKKPRRRIKTFDLYDSEASNDGLTEQDVECVPVDENSGRFLNPVDSALVKNSLKSFYSFYENLSFTDSMAALEDRLGNEDSLFNSGSHSSFIQLHSYKRLYKTHATMKKDIVSQENISVPITKDLPGIEDIQGQESICISNTPTSKAHTNVRTSLPLNLPTQGIYQDYIPTLRTICKSEQLREQAKIKRRFQHYLDCIGISLKDSTLSVLCMTFR